MYNDNMSDKDLEKLEQKVFEARSKDIGKREAFVLDDKLSEATDRLKEALDEEKKWKARYCNHCRTSMQ